MTEISLFAKSLNSCQQERKTLEFWPNGGAKEGSNLFFWTFSNIRSTSKETATELSFRWWCRLGVTQHSNNKDKPNHTILIVTFIDRITLNCIGELLLFFCFCYQFDNSSTEEATTAKIEHGILSCKKLHLLNRKRSVVREVYKLYEFMPV